MYERVFKAVTILSCILTVVVCVSVQFFPKMREDYVQADVLEEWLMDAEYIPTATETVDETIIPIEELEVATEELEADNKRQLNIQMPDSVDLESVTVKNDYLNQIVNISFDTDIRDFSSNFNIVGSPDHIATLSYYNNDNRGVIALTLDGVYETEYEIDDEDKMIQLDIINPHDIYEKVVVLDAGHGGKQPGAVMLSTIEKDINLEILLETKKLLDQYDNIKVYYTRLSDVNPTLEQRANLANRSNANLFISIHNNSNLSGRFNNQEGTHLLYSQSDMREYSSARLAAICVRNMSNILGSKNLGLMEADNIYIIRTSKVPVALIEVGYLTNRGELEKLNTKEYRELAAQGIVNSILEAFEDGF